MNSVNRGDQLAQAPDVASVVAEDIHKVGERFTSEVSPQRGKLCVGSLAQSLHQRGKIVVRVPGQLGKNVGVETCLPAKLGEGNLGISLIDEASQAIKHGAIHGCSSFWHLCYRKESSPSLTDVFIVFAVLPLSGRVKVALLLYSVLLYFGCLRKSRLSQVECC